MGQALYRKYRSKNLDEIVGQKAVTTALKNALKSGHISHAYLFTGPRGTGKTSIARILAFEINKIPYDSHNLPLDIIEIDAASNRRIDEIRDLREKVRIAPVSAQYKVYIIDEVHMLTREAFNALLKTLEEPPAHVIFILATTEAHKLPETIISRTQRYSFQLATEQEVHDHLSSIANQEKIIIDDAALTLLARHSGGSMRDALSLLDQVRHSEDSITADTVRMNLGLPAYDIVDRILQAIQSNDYSVLIAALESARSDGASAPLIAEQLIVELRNQLVHNNTADITANVQLIQNLIKVEASTRPDIQLELALIAAQITQTPHPHVAHRINSATDNTPGSPKTVATHAKLETPKTEAPNLKSYHETKPSNNTNSVVREQPIAIVTKETAKPEPVTSKKPSQEIISESKNFDENIWSATLESLRTTHNTIYSILRMSQPQYSDTSTREIHLLFKFPFHQKRMNEAKNKQIILDALAAQGLSGYELHCDVLPKENRNEFMGFNQAITIAPSQSEPVSSSLSQIRNVFGGAEVLE